MAESKFDGTILLNKSLRFVSFHPKTTNTRAYTGHKHVVVPAESIDVLWCEEDRGNGGSYYILSGERSYELSREEYLSICRSLGITDEIP